MSKNIIISLLVLFFVVSCANTKKGISNISQIGVNNAQNQEDILAKKTNKLESLSNRVQAGAIDLCSKLTDLNGGCIFGFALVNTSQDKEENKINIKESLFDLGLSDDEIGVILSREYAAKMLLASKASNNKKHSQQEMDYIGLYIAAIAGYNITNAEDIWKKLALKNDSENFFLTTNYPLSQTREIELGKYITEIKRKKYNGAILLPKL